MSTTTIPPNKLKLLDTFRDLAPPLTDPVRDDLYKSVAERGVQEPIVVWHRVPDVRVVVDGHNRLAAALAASLDAVPIREVEFLDEEHAIDWAMVAIFSRRHLTPQQLSEIRGRFYERQKGARGGNRRPKGQAAPLDDSVADGGGNTAKRLADAAGVDLKTVKRDAAYVRDLDKLRPDLREDARAGKLTKTDVRILAAYSDDAQAEIAEIAEQGKVSIAVAAEQYEAGNEVAEPAAEVTPAERARSDMEAANETLSDWCKQLRAMGRHVPLSPWLTESQAELIRADIAKAARQAIHNVGHNICPHCNGAGCGFCHECGWMPKDAYEKALRQLEASSK